ncbi:MAG: hypothetical protein CL600_12780 [Alteromonas sp.]|nr:hypothetical protein [Alteromonas sp.]
MDYLAPGDSITLPFTADKIGDTKVEVTLNELPSIDDLDRIIIRSRSSTGRILTMIFSQSFPIMMLKMTG